MKWGASPIAAQAILSAQEADTVRSESVLLILDYSFLLFMPHLRSRPGVTLMELVLFVAILAIAMSFIIPFLFFAEENNVRQQSQSLVQQAGAEILQGVGRRLRDAERIQYPPLTTRVGNVLMLQSSVTGFDPVVIGLSGSSLVAIEGTTVAILSSPQVRVRNLVVTNTSVSADKQSVYLAFDVQQPFGLVQSGATFRTFQTAFTLFPADIVSGNPCSSPPTAFACGPELNTVHWETCSPSRTPHQTMLLCTP